MEHKASMVLGCNLEGDKDSGSSKTGPRSTFSACVAWWDSRPFETTERSLTDQLAQDSRPNG